MHDVLCPLGSAGNAPGTPPGPLSGFIPDTQQGNLAVVLLVFSYRLDQMSLFHRVGPATLLKPQYGTMDKTYDCLAMVGTRP